MIFVLVVWGLYCLYVTFYFVFFDAKMTYPILFWTLEVAFAFGLGDFASAYVVGA